ncbi:hypothetical protein FE784_21425 [Paenibacillus hemerocallicola]|uniref:HAD family phosphatase n=1 Tax=Paenibacillus hemerocallicola TaxID=1172614 RepID=A0A5C4T536_9BACL|nr:HAD hydrolase family protein [Paenibacillus hemerocallicola]TNJ64181.1 hypothetical protein FE784_21425 [Paenibacillus hemerocallicola]
MSSPFPKLFITDLDGTALGGGYRPYAKLPPAFSAFLHRLAERGCMWATCTTWDAQAQFNLIDASPDAPPPSYLIAGSGLGIFTFQAGERTPVEPYTAIMAQRSAETVRAFLRPLIRDVCARFDCGKMSFNGYWFSMTVQDEETERMAAYMGEQASRYPDLRIEVIAEENRFYTHPAFLRKETAVLELLRLTGLDPNEVAIAGDERMDLGMMEAHITAHAICPGNAHPEVKERVLALSGAAGTASCSDGVIEAFGSLAQARGWSQ